MFSQLRCGLTQTQLGQAIGLSRNWLGKIELCELKRDVLRFSRLCKALELDPGRLIKQLETDSTRGLSVRRQRKATSGLSF